MKIGFKPNRARLYYAIVVAILCTVSYIAGITRNSGSLLSPATTNVISVTENCNKNPIARNSFAHELDFAAHHNATDPPPAKKARELHFPVCPAKYSEFTPCEGNDWALQFPREQLVYRERHCPIQPEKKLKCLVAAPVGYQVPFRWPESRDVSWFANVPHKELTVEKKNQNWIHYNKDRFIFPGGGTMFPNGADAYIDDIAELIDLRGGDIRTAVDTGCGVASWGAYLLSRNIVTMSFAPRDTHEAQVQFALERGVPALIGILASIRLPYPSRAFDMAHCSRCLIPWAQYDGLYLIEVDRILRPGGYWILSGPPINWQRHHVGWNRTRQDLKAEQDEVEKVARSLCWKKLIQKNDLAIWQKPTNHIHCKVSRKVFKEPKFCQAQNPDTAWYTKLEACLTPLPEVSNTEEVAGGKLAKWPQRLNAIPPRISNGNVEGISAADFQKDSDLWRERVAHYKTVDFQLAEKRRYRNLLDMNAGLGGFAAALVDDPVWVMNIVPVEAKTNTLGVIYERGLIGTYQNWCEAMSTYPRTYDFIHADSVFSKYKDRCDIEDIVLEMDRILRPRGSVIIRDDVDMILKVKTITDAMGWEGRIGDHEKSPHLREKILYALKPYWTLKQEQQEQS